MNADSGITKGPLFPRRYDGGGEPKFDLRSLEFTVARQEPGWTLFQLLPPRWGARGCGVAATPTGDGGLAALQDPASTEAGP